MSTITIPQFTLKIGQTTFGPRNMNKEHTLTLTIDRTVTGGLNSLTADTVLTVAVNTSVDGTTFQNDAVFTAFGGTVTNKLGVPENASVLIIRGLGGQGTQIEIVATVAGPSEVTVAGSIVLS